MAARLSQIVFAIGFFAAVLTSGWMVFRLIRGMMTHGRAGVVAISTALAAVAIFIFGVACIRALRRRASFLETRLLVASLAFVIGRLLIEWLFVD